MSTNRLAPFSARNFLEATWIDSEFPSTARIGLLHLLRDAIAKDYVSGWIAVAKELGRIARATPRDYNSNSSDTIKQARFDSELHLTELRWDRVYDFCERLYGQLSQEWTGYRNDTEVSITKAESQAFINQELNLLFEEEHLGYEFREGSVQRRGKRHTVNQMTKADAALSDHRLGLARKHYMKARRCFTNRSEPDFENVVKETVCAVEAAAKELFPEARASTLNDFIKWATNQSRTLIPRPIGQSLEGLYAFRNSGEGVAHGATSGGAVTADLAEYVLSVGASQILLLRDMAPLLEDSPF